MGNLAHSTLVAGQPGTLSGTQLATRIGSTDVRPALIAVAAPASSPFQLLGFSTMLCVEHPTRTAGGYGKIEPVRRLYWAGQLLMSMWAAGRAAGLAALAAPAPQVLRLLAEQQLGLASQTSGLFLTIAADALSAASAMALTNAYPLEVVSRTSASTLSYLHICMNGFAAALIPSLYLTYKKSASRCRAGTTWCPASPRVNPDFRNHLPDPERSTLLSTVTEFFKLGQTPARPAALFDFDCKTWQIRCLLASSDLLPALRRIPGFAMGTWFVPDLLRSNKVLVVSDNSGWQRSLRDLTTGLTFVETTAAVAAGAEDAEKAAEAAPSE